MRLLIVPKLLNSHLILLLCQVITLGVPPVITVVIAVFSDVLGKTPSQSLLVKPVLVFTVSGCIYSNNNKEIFPVRQ